MNTNSRVDEDLDVYNPDVIVPTLSTGDPFTLGEGLRQGDDSLFVYLRTPDPNTVQEFGTEVGDVISLDIGTPSGSVNANSAVMSIDSVSQIGTIQGTASTTSADLIIIDLEATFGHLTGTEQSDLTDTTDDGFAANFINYDFRS